MQNSDIDQTTHGLKPSELSTVHKKGISGVQGQIILILPRQILREPVLGGHPVLSRE